MTAGTAGLRFPEPPLTDGVVALRPFADGDLDWIVRACQDPEIPRWTRVPTPYGRAQGHAFLTAARAPAPDLALAIVAADDGAPLGSVGVKTSGHPDGTGEVGYWVAAEARGRGVATRAVRLVAPWALRTAGLLRLELHTHPGNAASQRVAEGAGFQREGVLRAYEACGNSPGRTDVVMFSLVPGDPAAAAG